MTNEVYVLFETNKERSLVKNSACRKVGRTKKCMVGTEYKTDRQLARLNGPVRTWCLKERYDEKTINEMPNDIRQMYVKKWSLA